MAGEVKSYEYDPARVSVIVGNIPITGFVKNTFINVSFTEDAIDYTPGLSSGTVTFNPSREGDITFNLIQASDSNKELQKYASRVRNRQEEWFFPLMIVNNSGGELASADAAWVMKEPSLSLSQGQEDRAWTLKTANLTLLFNTNYRSING